RPPFSRPPRASPTMLLDGDLAANAPGGEDHPLAVFQVLQRKQVLERPRIFWLAVETDFPFRLIGVAQLFAFRRNIAVGGFTKTPIDDFAVEEIEPTQRQLPWMGDVFRA